MSVIAKPIFYNAENEIPPHAQVVDAYTVAKRELFFLQNPHIKKTSPDYQTALENFLANEQVTEVWVYYPWANKVVHTVPEDLYTKLRTARNRNIITESEQLAFRNLTVAVAGLSVGSAAVHSMTASGGPKHLRIADFDTLEITNLNRIRASLLDIGTNKTEIAAHQIWELDPFADITLWPDGLSQHNLETFLTEPNSVDVFIDEMDSIDLKILGRIIAKKHRIPVLMATDNGDSVVFDVERFDLEPDREIFHGLLGSIEWEQIRNLPYQEWLKLATKIVGPEYLTERMQDSLLEIGKSVASVPQLGTTANLSGAAISFALRNIANNVELPSGRYVFGLESVLTPNYNTEEQAIVRKQKTQDFLNKFLSKKL